MPTSFTWLSFDSKVRNFFVVYHFAHILRIMCVHALVASKALFLVVDWLHLRCLLLPYAQTAETALFTNFHRGLVAAEGHSEITILICNRFIIYRAKVFSNR